jgi:ribonucleoside-diphosphate reductase alpha chain
LTESNETGTSGARMDFRDSGQGAGDVATVMDDLLDDMKAQASAQAQAAPVETRPEPEVLTSSTVQARRFPVVTDSSRDALLTEFGKDTLNDRYLLPGESYQDLFARVAAAYSDDAAHAQRVYDYISRLWFMPATPVLSNGGTGRGLPISCYLNSVDDSLEGIVNTWNENVWLASRGGGIGTYWGNVRGIGEPVGLNGKTSGIIPFVRVMDSLTLAISQGSLRRGSAACYLDVSHPEIEEFLEIRKPSGDFNRRVHGSGPRWQRLPPAQPEGSVDPRHRQRPRPVPEAGRSAPGDRRALYRVQRHGEPHDAQTSSRPGPQSVDLQPLLGNHAAHRPRPSGQ